jgi:hypothetical protein
VLIYLDGEPVPFGKAAPAAIEGGVDGGVAPGLMPVDRGPGEQPGA